MRMLINRRLHSILVLAFCLLHCILKFFDLISQTAFLLVKFVHFFLSLLFTVLFEIVVQIIGHFAQVPELD